MKTIFFISLLVVLCGPAIGLIKEYIFIQDKQNWWTAWQYCRKYYRDLATITTLEENQRVKASAGANFTRSWIGLHREWYSNNWWWSDGDSSSYAAWASNQQGFNSEYCAGIDTAGWSDYNCGQQLPFFCYRSLILVKENMTWEQAIKHCRTHYSDLALISSTTLLQLAKMEAGLSQTVSVWTGLRFLAGKWVWVSAQSIKGPNSLPSCPDKPYRCGARNMQQDLWEANDCREKLNFICHLW